MSIPYVGFTGILVKALPSYSFTWGPSFLDFVYNVLSVFFLASIFFWKMIIWQTFHKLPF